MRDNWDREMQKEARERARERNEWEDERRRWADNVRRHQEEWERWEKERSQVRWGEPQGDERCVAYDTRFYTATLANLPPSMHWMQACMETPIEIHGVRIDSPESCEKKGSDVVGRWKVTSDELACRTYWEAFSDTGCVSNGSRKRRIEARLENLQPEDDWVEMCATTSAEVRGTHYSSPTYCHPRSGWGWKAMMGIWEIEDESC
ncbi:hypothetical protein JAAARDRAFT_52353 [Jaapia argillacea MUCL 33604]|uniref:Uncharacterized protein n=1 Tax=Jaapia argillacea MUCL 33604 TaxID=933084 RepID=A0A067QE25_9AGAM|nr:hypothetical protein JAAARDRAFT_52353 [Jaapia argillacea MUCL 33604]